MSFKVFFVYQNHFWLQTSYPVPGLFFLFFLLVLPTCLARKSHFESNRHCCCFIYYYTFILFVVYILFSLICSTWLKNKLKLWKPLTVIRRRGLIFIFGPNIARTIVRVSVIIRFESPNMARACSGHARVMPWVVYFYCWRRKYKWCLEIFVY